VFKDLLAKYYVKEKLIPVVYYELANFYHQLSKGMVEQEPMLKAQPTDVMSFRYGIPAILAPRIYCKNRSFQREFYLIGKMTHFDPLKLIFNLIY